MGLFDSFTLFGSPTPVIWWRAPSLPALSASGISSILARKGVFDKCLLSGAFALSLLSGLQACQALVWAQIATVSYSVGTEFVVTVCGEMATHPNKPLLNSLFAFFFFLPASADFLFLWVNKDLKIQNHLIWTSPPTFFSSLILQMRKLRLDCKVTCLGLYSPRES